MSPRRHGVAMLKGRHVQDAYQGDFVDWTEPPFLGSFENGRLVASKIYPEVTTDYGNGTTSTRGAKAAAWARGPELPTTNGKRAVIVHFRTNSNGDVNPTETAEYVNSAMASMTNVNYDYFLENASFESYPIIEQSSLVDRSDSATRGLRAGWVVSDESRFAYSPSPAVDLDSYIYPSTDYWLSSQQNSEGLTAALWDHFPGLNLNVGEPLAETTAPKIPPPDSDGGSNSGWTSGQAWETMVNTALRPTVLGTFNRSTPYTTGYYGLIWSPYTP